MPFDKNKFITTRFIPRQEELEFKDLQAFFDENEKPVFTVKGLTGVEYAKAREAADRNKDIQAIFEGLASSKSKNKTEAIKDLLNLGNDVPQIIAIKLELFLYGLVEPEPDLDFAKKLCKNFPIEFLQITQKIEELTGMGAVAEKKP